MPSPIFVRCCFQAAEKRTRSGPRRGSSRSTSTASATAMSRHWSDVLQARADEDRRDVGEQVEHDVERCDEERDRLHGRHVTGADGLDEEEPDARVVEDRLHHDDASGEVGEVERGDLERRREGVRHGVPPEDSPLGEPLEPGHLHEVALEDLDGRRPHDPRRVRNDGDDQRDHREDELLRVLPRPRRRAPSRSRSEARGRPWSRRSPRA